MALDLYARAEKAYADAEIAEANGKQTKANDLNEEGRLWLASAVAESERLQIEEERLWLERAQDRSYTEANQKKAATDLRIQRRARERAAAIATQEADNALALVDARADAKWGRASLRKAKTGLLNRADLNLSAAQALGATTSHINEARSLLAKLRKSRSLEARKAQQMLWRSESLLAEARAKKAQPDSELATQLMKEAIARGYQTESDEFGVAVWDRRAIKGGRRIANERYEYRKCWPCTRMVQCIALGCMQRIRQRRPALRDSKKRLRRMLRDRSLWILKNL